MPTRRMEFMGVGMRMFARRSVLAEEACIGAPFGKMACEQGMAQGDAVTLRTGVESVFVYGATARFHVQKLAGRGVVYDHVAVLVYFAHETAAPALVAQVVPYRAVFQIAGNDGPGRKHGSLSEKRRGSVRHRAAYEAARHYGAVPTAGAKSAALLCKVSEERLS